MRFPRDVSQNMPVLLNLGPVLLYLGPSYTPIQANRTRPHGQNSAKQCQTVTDSASRLQENTELHQKDLRIIPYLLQILGPGYEVISVADTFLALSLIVAFSCTTLHKPHDVSTFSTHGSVNKLIYLRMSELTTLWTFD